MVWWGDKYTYIFLNIRQILCDLNVLPVVGVKNCLNLIELSGEIIGSIRFEADVEDFLFYELT